MASNPTIIPPGQDEEEGVLVEESQLSKLEESNRRSQVSLAKQYPRSITKFRDELKEIVILNQAVAMEMMYSLPRAGKQLIGPSVRFAEAIVSCWGNCAASVEVVDVNRQTKTVTAEGRFFDAEKNSIIAVRVPRRNVTKKLDDDSYQVTGSAASSIALRNAILRAVPKALWADLFELAKKTAAGEVASLDKVRVEMVKLFTAVGVTEQRLFNTLGVAGLADIGADEIVAMKAWRHQLVEKTSTIEEIFGSPLEEEIEGLMAALAWPEAKKQMSRSSYRGRPGDLLEYLRVEAKKAGVQVAASAPQEQPKTAGVAVSTKEEDTATAGQTGTTAAASTSPENKPAQQAAAPAPAKRAANFDDF